MRNLTFVADKVGNNLSTASIALETIANLLGSRWLRAPSS